MRVRRSIAGFLTVVLGLAFLAAPSPASANPSANLDQVLSEKSWWIDGFGVTMRVLAPACTVSTGCTIGRGDKTTPNRYGKYRYGTYVVDVNYDSVGIKQTIVIGTTASNNIYYTTQTAVGSGTWTGWESFPGGGTGRFGADFPLSAAEPTLRVVGTDGWFYCSRANRWGWTSWARC
ncbi:hypothetical protein [Asanoa iriomotensis]|uniref:Secreted protein n=1 Tax=Asanoa iriomotensis TaxID=234613 RepID=A0ABQ4C5W9_9ACTN|nr:hypothetical protein [Asanoa iriomotensis]GIF58167.1 hypothetical protein Air01nite_42620 [Asanoa iriomotensis]